MTGLVVVAAVLAVACAFGWWRLRYDGRLRPSSGQATKGSPMTLGVTELGRELGERATLVQFSTAFCQPCRVARVVLGDVAATTEGVVHVEIDAESQLDLVRRLGIVRTPTTLVLDGSGQIVRRASGAPRRAEVLASLPG